MHLNAISRFFVFILADLMHSPNILLMTEKMVSTLLRSLYSRLLYPLFICFLYLPRVFHTGTDSNLAGIIQSASMYSLTNLWFFSSSYPLSATTRDIGKLCIAERTGIKSVLSWAWECLIFTLQINCLFVSADIVFLINTLLVAMSLGTVLIVVSVLFP